MTYRHKNDLLGIFARHNVAANLLMIMMILAGVVALKLLNVQFFPSYEPDVIAVRTTWSGASAEDVEQSLTTPMEQNLRNVDNIKTMTSTSASGISAVSIEFEAGTDRLIALEQVNKEVDDFDNLPEDADAPVVSLATRTESIARLLLSGPVPIDELRRLAQRFEDELLEAGIDRVQLIGLPDREIEISLGRQDMHRLNLGLAEISARINQASRDIPAGKIGEKHGTRQLRSLGQRRTVSEFTDIPIGGAGDGRLVLGDIADIRSQENRLQPYVSVNGQRAVVLLLQRSVTGDTLKSAAILDRWLEKTRPTLPSHINLQVFGKTSDVVQERIDLLLKNGIGGLALVLSVLFLFLSGRVAFWVGVGIPVSFMATLAVIYATGGSINMISLFALIMALGIIVDDAIVVAEDAQAHYEIGEDPLRAAEGGARRMLAPVMASSLTTIAAFLPLFLVGGRIGNIMSAIPMVIVSVIIASLIESFFILPGHLQNTFRNIHSSRRSGVRTFLDTKFNKFRDGLFRRLVEISVRNRFSTIAFTITCLMLAVGLIAGGRLSWVFFPSPESTSINANVRFVAGTDRETVNRFLGRLEEGLLQTIEEIDEKVVDTWYVSHGASSGRGRSINGDRIGSIYVELSPPDSRSITNEEIARHWRKKIRPPAGVESFFVASRRSGPSSRDLEIRLLGDDVDTIKSAALELAETLKGIAGVSTVDDDLPYGQEQLVIDLKTEGEVLGLSNSELARQIRANYDGLRVQRFQQGRDEIDVYLRLHKSERQILDSLDSLPLRLPSGETMVVAAAARWRSKQGFESLRHANGKLAVGVTANVDNKANNTQLIVESLSSNALPELVRKYGIQYSLEGRAERQRSTFADLKLGMAIGLLMIYLILAWVFGSYGWPLVVISTIPFGLTGAILGHWVLGMNLTLLSLFGFFALSGIVVNDSIILVTFYKQLRQAGNSINDALTEAACARLRAVLLTSLTTIGGLTPLLFETSRQAQFLIPMATSIAFGLAFATVLILFFVPAMLSVYEHAAQKAGRKQSLTTVQDHP